jgi:hypothetical protein
MKAINTKAKWIVVCISIFAGTINSIAVDTTPPTPTIGSTLLHPPTAA